MTYCWRIRSSDNEPIYFGHINDRSELDSICTKIMSDRPNDCCKYDLKNNVWIEDQGKKDSKKILENIGKAQISMNSIFPIIERHRIEIELLIIPTTITSEKYQECLDYYKKLVDIKMGNDPNVIFPTKPVIDGVSIQKIANISEEKKNLQKKYNFIFKKDK